MNQQEIDNIYNAIKTKIGTMQCPMCKGLDFEVTTKYIQNILAAETNGTISPTNIDSLATIPISCKKCGFVSQHRFDFFLK